MEAGDWPAEPTLEELARRAVDAADRAIEAAEAPRRLSPASSSKEETEGSELSIVFTNDEAIRKLNLQWRGKDKPTNVLSFPQAGGPLLGDVIMAAETVAREAALADKTLEEHMAHLLIHGYLHLLGFDHEAEEDAEEMEQLERVALKSLGISDPYAALPGQ